MPDHTLSIEPLIYAPPVEPHLDVLHADDDLLVIAKPSGLLSVPGKDPAHADCIDQRAKSLYSDARIVHRLDLDTSGVMVLARNKNAHRHLGLQFEKRQVTKTYVARVWGVMNDDAGEVDAPLICDWPNRPRQMIDHDRGRSAQTVWRVLTREPTATRVLLAPRTGRSHQLRVHMLSLGHPILGDNIYAHPDARKAAYRLQLHAETLSFRHPTGGRPMAFQAPCPF
ncbi:MAG: RluA family pseudouridine synthase [Pseudomonadota bacterium]